MRILLASHNAKKREELENLVRAAGLETIDICTLSDVDPYPEPVEDGRTFSDNALIKARAGVHHTGIMTLADDSGLAVAELNGCPGVLSARWAGEHGNDQANNELLLAQLKDTPLKRRQAAFHSVLALVDPNGQEYLVEGYWPGSIATSPRGDNGFGYDPIFLPDDAQGRTSAELSAVEKNHISHRARALQKLLPILREISA
ncbi:RdgB/HAM1 family non-canonical purine NTP pyrophosphatase [Corynebacterium sp. ES2730-CONJ]|uniref:RdgB/HAM1 family non-canonical purine NTP pyrophosphatase n=1 Tax=Corynebacterium sp. ES2730-CONJ TaxID=2973941 RepID=UPI00216B0A95|nr:RdgB/HAM1 family non-canonical purine NTP pyrophosphatase [Corynebacterium sp. ES2730-CONJ]MCS4532579.1 RdgB/HAM1 family non-canonical purine NTP pyrophosphatase [Corynebacterium sp. ES2730-CONJ]